MTSDLIRQLSRIPFRSPSLRDRSLDQDKVQGYFSTLEEWREDNKNFNKQEKDDIISIITEAVDKAEYIPYTVFWNQMLRSFCAICV